MRTTCSSNIHLQKSKMSIRVKRNHTFEGVTSIRTRIEFAQNIPREGSNLGEHVLALVLRTSWASESYYLSWAGSWRPGAAAAGDYQELQWVHYQTPAVCDNSLIILCYVYLLKGLLSFLLNICLGIYLPKYTTLEPGHVIVLPNITAKYDFVT